MKYLFLQMTVCIYFTYALIMWTDGQKIKIFVLDYLKNVKQIYQKNQKENKAFL